MTAPWRLLPCANCCDCNIFVNMFERGSVGEAWEVKSGNWSISNGALRGCGTGTRIMWTGEEDLSDNFTVLSPVWFRTAGQKYRLFFGGEDDGAWSVEFENGPILSGAFKIYIRILDADGVQFSDTQEQNVAWADYGQLDDIYIGMCVWSDGDEYRIVSAVLYLGYQRLDWRMGKISATELRDGRAGLGGDDNGTCLIFGDYYLQRPEGSCPKCVISCPHVLWDEKPSCLKRTFTGFGNGPCLLWGSWEGCRCLNRTIYLADWQQADPLTSDKCAWRSCLVQADFCFNSTTLYTGGVPYWEAKVCFIDGCYWLYVTLYAGYHGARTTYWRANLGESKPEAKTLDVANFELVVDQVSDICDLSNVTLHVEAVDGDPCPPQQNRCLVCGPQCGEYPPEIRLRTSGFGGANDGDFILSPGVAGVVDWYHYECNWRYSGAVDWIVCFMYDRQAPAQYNVFVLALR
jgi:hypothetical protein